MWPLIINRKSYVGFRLKQKSMTLNDRIVISTPAYLYFRFPILSLLTISAPPPFQAMYEYTNVWVRWLLLSVAGNYSRLACEFYFVRSLGYYIIHIYVPSCLIVVLSWISFWLHRDASPARVSLGITTVLTMTTILSSSNASLPKISYLKSIDIFLVTCFIMVFASLLEYACVSFLGLVKPTTTMIDMNRQHQQRYQHHRYQAPPLRQTRDYRLDSPSSIFDSSMRDVFITGETRTTDNGRTSQGSMPAVT